MDAGRALLLRAHDAERRLDAALQTPHRPTDPPIVALRAELRGHYRALLLDHFDLACRKGLERACYMRTHHRPIEELRTKMRRAGDAAASARGDVGGEAACAAALASQRRARHALAQTLDEARAFYEGLVVALQQRHAVDCLLPLPALAPPAASSSADADATLARRFAAAAAYLAQPPPPSGSPEARAAAVRGVVATCLVFLGDLARYAQMHVAPPPAEATGAAARASWDTAGAEAWAPARALYGAAQQLAPQRGNAANQLAVVASYAHDDLAILAGYLRALAAPQPFPTARDNLKKFFALAAAKAAEAAPPNGGGGGRGRGGGAVLSPARPVRGGRGGQIAAGTVVAARPAGAPPSEAELSASWVAVHAALFGGEAAAAVERLGTRALAQLRTAVAADALPPRRLATLVDALLCAVDTAADGADGDGAEPPSGRRRRGAGAATPAVELLLAVVAASVPLLSGRDPGVASVDFRTAELYAALTPPLLWLAHAPAAADAAAACKKGTRRAFAAALVDLGNALPPAARAPAAALTVTPLSFGMLGLRPLTAALASLVDGATRGGGGGLRAVAAPGDARARTLAHGAVVGAALRRLASGADGPPLLSWDGARFGPAVAAAPAAAAAPMPPPAPPAAAAAAPRFASGTAAAAPSASALPLPSFGGGAVPFAAAAAVLDDADDALEPPPARAPPPAGGVRVVDNPFGAPPPPLPAFFGGAAMECEPLEPPAAAPHGGSAWDWGAAFDGGGGFPNALATPGWGR